MTWFQEHAKTDKQTVRSCFTFSRPFWFDFSKNGTNEILTFANLTTLSSLGKIFCNFKNHLPTCLTGMAILKFNSRQEQTFLHPINPLCNCVQYYKSTDLCLFHIIVFQSQVSLNLVNFQFVFITQQPSTCSKSLESHKY